MPPADCSSAALRRLLAVLVAMECADFAEAMVAGFCILFVYGGLRRRGLEGVEDGALGLYWVYRVYYDWVSSIEHFDRSAWSFESLFISFFCVVQDGLEIDIKEIRFGDKENKHNK